MLTRRRMTFLLLALLLLAGGYLALTLLRQAGGPAVRRFLSWQSGNEATRAALITVQREACPGAPFILPADGFVGLLYADPRGPYSASSPHQGIDIFSNSDPGVTPVYSAAAGYVTREPGWVSSLIQRLPDDPLQPGRPIWLYYTHMASRDGESFIQPAFPPGTSGLFVEQGTLLGYTGDYNGASPRSVWTHLHFSVVRDDGRGNYTNELEFANTLDPSPYLGMEVSYERAEEAAGCLPP
jgi:murein DD-endopeptidase MepM/ murein hydrolase activator NlpD